MKLESNKDVRPKKAGARAILATAGVPTKQTLSTLECIGADDLVCSGVILKLIKRV